MEGCGWGWIGYYGGLWLRLDWLLWRAVAEVGLVAIEGCVWGWTGYHGGLWLRLDWLLWRAVAEVGLVTMEGCGWGWIGYCGWGWIGYYGGLWLRLDWLLWRAVAGLITMECCGCGWIGWYERLSLRLGWLLGRTTTDWLCRVVKLDKSLWKWEEFLRLHLKYGCYLCYFFCGFSQCNGKWPLVVWCQIIYLN